jgi:hypothetical protein
MLPAAKVILQLNQKLFCGKYENDIVNEVFNYMTNNLTLIHFSNYYYPSCQKKLPTCIYKIVLQFNRIYL